VAVLDSEPETDDAVSRLSSAGFLYEVLSGGTGRDHIDPESDDGVLATVRKLIGVFGDEHRILDRLDEAMTDGKLVVSVQIESGDPSEAISIFQDHGGHYIWKFDNWTFTRIGD
jgi:hypothetical protein